MTKLRISKKQAAHLADLINSCTVWSSMAENNIAKGEHDKVRRYMKRHDTAAAELNALLGTQAVCLYNVEAV